MSKFIGMEYLVALALIELNKAEISLKDLTSYEIKVSKIFEEEKISAVFLTSSNYALEMVRNYSDCFELIDNDTVLKKNVSNDVLISRFLSYLSSDVLKAALKVKKVNG